MTSTKATLSTLFTLGFMIVIGIIMLGINDPTGLTGLIGILFIAVPLISGIFWGLKEFK
jgi:hypothetical protein